MSTAPLALVAALLALFTALPAFIVVRGLDAGASSAAPNEAAPPPSSPSQLASSYALRFEGATSVHWRAHAIRHARADGVEYIPDATSTAMELHAIPEPSPALAFDLMVTPTSSSRAMFATAASGAEPEAVDFVIQSANLTLEVGGRSFACDGITLAARHTAGWWLAGSQCEHVGTLGLIKCACGAAGHLYFSRKPGEVNTVTVAAPYEHSILRFHSVRPVSFESGHVFGGSLRVIGSAFAAVHVPGAPRGSSMASALCALGGGISALVAPRSEWHLASVASGVYRPGGTDAPTCRKKYDGWHLSWSDGRDSAWVGAYGELSIPLEDGGTLRCTDFVIGVSADEGSAGLQATKDLLAACRARAMAAPWDGTTRQLETRLEKCERDHDPMQTSLDYVRSARQNWYIGSPHCAWRDVASQAGGAGEPTPDTSTERTKQLAYLCNCGEKTIALKVSANQQLLSFDFFRAD